MPPLDKDAGPEPSFTLRKSIQVNGQFGMAITVSGDMPYVMASALYDGLTEFLRDYCARMFLSERLGFVGRIPQKTTIERGGYKVEVLAVIVSSAVAPDGKPISEISQDLADLMKIVNILVSDLGRSRLPPELFIAVTPTLTDLEFSPRSTAQRPTSPEIRNLWHGREPGPLR